MAAIKASLLAITDAGDGVNLHVQNGPSGFLVSMQQIDDYIAGRPDPGAAIAYNLAARLAASGVSSCQTAAGSGVASASALSLLNSASFQVY